MRMPTDTSLASYIELVTGTRPRLENVPKHETANLPLFLRERYQFLRAFLYGRRLYFAIDKTKPGELSAPKYASEAELLKKQLSADVILMPFIRKTGGRGGGDRTKSAIEIA